MWVPIAARFARLFRVVMPDPFVLAVGLTGLTFALCLVCQDITASELTRVWSGDRGLWGLLGFTMQMVLILVTGYAVAAAPVVRSLLSTLAGLPRTARQATALVALVSMAAGLLNWGLGLITGALLARAVGANGARLAARYRVHYPLVCAAGYSAMLTWHGGMSGTAPLMMTTQANVERFLGSGFATLPFTATIFGFENMVLTGGLLVLVPLALALMTPVSPALSDAAPEGISRSQPPIEHIQTKAESIENSSILGLCVALGLGAATGFWWWDHGFAELDPNGLNLTFLFVGALLHRTLRSFRNAVQEATSGISGILIQFPLYAGILGMLKHSGLGATIATQLTDASTADSHSILTMFSAAVLNLVVPSGGGQWAIQGPIALESARQLGIPGHLTVLAVAYGDQLTNMLQPFWALPLLAITGVRARDLLGYTTLVMVIAGGWLAAGLFMFR